MPAGSLRKCSVNQTTLNHCPQGFSAPHRFKQNKSPLPSDSLRSSWFSSPLADTSLNVTEQLDVMKGSGSIRKVLASGAKPLGVSSGGRRDVLLSVLSTAAVPPGLL